ncbi:hypothetical protein GXY_02596 [Novacetimonas hansenii ATCC 23769]|uniref:Uncharacterized protein n=1 Tax=Novacetimonas hansenii ATCC 23769 TaxID=714995 RepID=D5QBM5_NOVHA|nr:hypothetical protein GXY_02596 [Novacetimonas hansenii ATCC 23769]
MRTMYQARAPHALHDFASSTIRCGHFVEGMAKKGNGMQISPWQERVFLLR